MIFSKCFPHFDLQPYDKARNALALALSPVVRALVDPDGAMQNIRDLDNVCVLSNGLFPYIFINCIKYCKIHKAGWGAKERKKIL